MAINGMQDYLPGSANIFNIDIIRQTSAWFVPLEVLSLVNEQNAFLLVNETPIYYDQIQPGITVIISAQNYED